VLAFEGAVRIDGKLEGEVTSEDTLIVGEQAVVNAEIHVGSIVISGKISGDITAKKRIDIKASGEVCGNLKTPILTIEEGVIFQGTCDMRRSGETPTIALPDKEPETIELEEEPENSPQEQLELEVE